MGDFSVNIIEEKSIGNQRRSLCGVATNRQSQIFTVHQGIMEENEKKWHEKVAK